MKSKEEKSVGRVKTTTVSLAGLMGITAAEIVHPGSGAALAGGIGVLLDHLKSWRKDEHENRLAEFHEHLFDGLTPSESEELMRKPFATEDYYSFMRHLLDDEENAKASIYAKIFGALINGEIESNFKPLMVRSARELSVFEFDLITEYHAKKNNRLALQKLGHTKDPVKAHAIQNLIHHGYLFDKDGTRAPMPTELLSKMADILKA